MSFRPLLYCIFVGKKRVPAWNLPTMDNDEVDSFPHYSRKNEIREFASVTAFHRQDIGLANWVYIGHELDVRQRHRLLLKRQKELRACFSGLGIQNTKFIYP